jgi:hypothetical protein
VFGANAGQIWQATFESADLGTPIGQFAAVPANSGYFRQGQGPLPSTQPAVAVATPAGPRPRHGGHHR